MIDIIQCHRKKVYITLVITFLLSAVCVSSVKFYPLPELDAFVARKWSLQFYDRNGILLQVTPVDDGARREFTALAHIPKDLVRAILESEDSRFYFHNGVDYSAALRAFFQNASEKRRVSGASTITMQLARMMYPSGTRGWKAKIQDIINAHIIETRLTKKKILELYLNTLPFGYNTEGVTSAARMFFAAELQSITPGQISCLSVIPRRPVLYNPIDNPAACADAAFSIFKKVYGFQIQSQTFSSSEAIKDYLHATALKAKRYEWPFSMPHYIQYVQKKLRPGQTRVDLAAENDLQKCIEFEINEALKKASSSRIQNAAVLVIENKTTEVLAWAGSNDWFDQEHSGKIDGVLVPNQPGSSMKPFLYALALEQKSDNGKSLFSPAQVLPDIPMEFGRDSLYIPLNFNNRFNGPVLFRASLASSLNIPSVYLLSEIGVDNYLQFLAALGFESLKKTGKEADLGLALGAGEVSLAELVTGFSVFPRDGLYRPLRYEKDIKTNEDSQRVLEVDTARIICDILSDKPARVKGFGYSQVFETTYPAIFKTGTANQYQNIVALGATTEYTVGVWMGNFSGNTVVGKTGSSLPASIAKTVLDFLNDGKHISFQEPEHWKKIPICTVSGMKAGPLCSSSVYEYVPFPYASKDNEECSWHQKDSHNETILMYPAMFQQWFKEGFRKGMLDQSSSALKIITPVDGSLFYYDPIERQRQKILVEVIGGNDAEKNVQDGILRVLYDDKPLIENGKSVIVERPFSFYLPVERGAHSLQVQFGNEMHMVHFTVK